MSVRTIHHRERQPLAVLTVSYRKVNVALMLAAWVTGVAPVRNTL